MSLHGFRLQADALMKSNGEKEFILFRVIQDFVINIPCKFKHLHLARMDMKIKLFSSLCDLILE